MSKNTFADQIVYWLKIMHNVPSHPRTVYWRGMESDLFLPYKRAYLDVLHAPEMDRGQGECGTTLPEVAVVQGVIE